MLRLIITKKKLLATFLFLPIVFYQPFIFNIIIYAPLRIALYIQLTVYLFYKSKYKSIDLQDARFFFVIALCLIIMLINSPNSAASLFTVGNYTLVILFTWGLCRHLKYNTDKIDILVSLYCKFFYFNVLLAIASIVYYLVVGEYDLFEIKSEQYQNIFTPFGLLFVKFFMSVKVVRACSYFVEPVHAGIFYAANICILAPRLRNRSKYFAAVNGLGGILTFSVSFYLLLSVLYVIRKFNVAGVGIIFSVAALLFGSVSTLILDSLVVTSFSDRLERAALFNDILVSANYVALLFGHGVGVDLGMSKGVSSGLLLSILEIGIVGTLAMIYIACIVSRTVLVGALFLVASLVVDPLHMPLFWILIIMLGCIDRQVHL
jgi:hypothetical protein